MKFETQGFSPEEAAQYEQGWQEGFSDAVNGILKGMIITDNRLVTNYLKDPFESD